MADDHEIVRRGIRDYLQLLEDSVTVHEASSLEDVLHLLDSLGGAELVILDLNMPGMNRFAGIDIVRRRVPGVPVAILSGSVERNDVLRALEAGAIGFLPKLLGGEAMISALRLMLSGERYLPSLILDADGSVGDTRPPQAMHLTEREGQVLRHISIGLSNKEIARELGIQEVTVKLHVKALFRKLQVTNRTQAARRAIELGLSQ
ncbi:MAG TPA: response regulator transcription factor [Alphaproteobacteria bacterium]|nr:response regulator transcription factor [Alphaproteobacteria bacterium]